MSEVISYTDEKANSIKSFDVISNFMWRRATFLLKNAFKENEKILVMDPCAGGGKLLSGMNKAFEGKAYEPNYGPFMYAQYLFEQKDYDVNVVNMPLEFHFSSVNLPEYHLAISFPYTDREINSSMETCKECRQFKNYAYYVMYKSLDVLQEGGFGVFAIPASLLDKKKYEYEISCITNKAEVLSIEQYQDYAIILLKKDKLK